jgi:bacterioferritin-associated ferredoxin
MQESSATLEARPNRADTMIICSCNMLTDSDVRDLATDAGHPLTAGQVYDCLGCGERCGRCAGTIKRITQEALAPRHAGCRRRSATGAKVSASAVPWTDPAAFLPHPQRRTA